VRATNCSTPSILGCPIPRLLNALTTRTLSSSTRSMLNCCDYLDSLILEWLEVFLWCCCLCCGTKKRI
jgi:hypothetical protein